MVNTVNTQKAHRNLRRESNSVQNDNYYQQKLQFGSKESHHSFIMKYIEEQEDNGQRFCVHKKDTNHPENLRLQNKSGKNFGENFNLRKQKSILLQNQYRISTSFSLPINLLFYLNQIYKSQILSFKQYNIIILRN